MTDLGIRPAGRAKSDRFGGRVAEPAQCQPDTGGPGPLPSAHRGPGPVRVATRRAAGDLGSAVDVDRVAILAATQAAPLVIGAGNDGPVVGRVIATPADRRAGRAAFQGLHLGRVGALAVLGVERGADRAAQEPSGCGADGGAREAASRASAAENGTEGATRNCAGNGAGILVRGIRIIGTGGGAHGEQRSAKNLLVSHGFPVPPIPVAPPRIDVDASIRAKL